MSRVILTEAAALGLERCRKFLIGKNPLAAKRAASVIMQQFTRLETNPELGRPFDDELTLRELVIEFGGAGYIALYRYDAQRDCVYVLAFRHQKEAGYMIH